MVKLNRISAVALGLMMLGGSMLIGSAANADGHTSSSTQVVVQVAPVAPDKTVAEPEKPATGADVAAEVPAKVESEMSLTEKRIVTAGVMFLIGAVPLSISLYVIRSQRKRLATTS